MTEETLNKGHELNSFIYHKSQILESLQSIHKKIQIYNLQEYPFSDSEEIKIKNINDKEYEWVEVNREKLFKFISDEITNLKIEIERAKDEFKKL